VNNERLLKRTFPETIGIMNVAMDAAVATLPEPVSSAMCSRLRRASFALPRMGKETPQRCKEWRY
jgi:hypothetical protein